jgi:hypothetical protein
MSTKNVIKDKQVIATELTDNKLLHKKKPGRKKVEPIIYDITQREQAYINFLNWVLEKINMDQITQLAEFKNIPKSKLELINMEDTITEWSILLFPIFSKKELKFYIRKHINDYILTLLRYCTKGIGKNLKAQTIKTQVNKSVTNCHTYSIE